MLEGIDLLSSVDTLRHLLLSRHLFPNVEKEINRFVVSVLFHIHGAEEGFAYHQCHKTTSRNARYSHECLTKWVCLGVDRLKNTGFSD